MSSHEEVQSTLASLQPPLPHPCAECPWLRTSMPGYLGPFTAEAWTERAHGEGPIECHMTVRGDDQDWSEVRQCTGAAIFRGNICKSPRHPNVARLDADYQLVFGWDDEFIEHHERPFRSCLA